MFCRILPSHPRNLPTDEFGYRKPPQAILEVAAKALGGQPCWVTFNRCASTLKPLLSRVEKRESDAWDSLAGAWSKKNWNSLGPGMSSWGRLGVVLGSSWGRLGVVFIKMWKAWEDVVMASPRELSPVSRPQRHPSPSPAFISPRDRHPRKGTGTSGFHPAWGKRSDWRKLDGMWGKRSDWRKLGGMWGKRAGGQQWRDRSTKYWDSYGNEDGSDAMEASERRNAVWSRLFLDGSKEGMKRWGDCRLITLAPAEILQPESSEIGFWIRLPRWEKEAREEGRALEKEAREGDRAREKEAREGDRAREKEAREGDRAREEGTKGRAKRDAVRKDDIPQIQSNWM
ncbi:unnamed protein product [Darwinula stevensoni]|uniref:Uncharacterized protein n=1 Tax=Darwinula stevensoni TaxID=69355 RepID=A0A7R9A6Y8_9CRUS|nr:unnamed protein product [Darwinula stevensoni]CAG0896056.1 unnamed protein product [Darwinula stevensoni]